MTISDNIKFRAIGLLTSFTEYCRDKGVTPLKAVAPAPSAADTQHSPPAPNILGVTDLPPSPDSLDASTSSSCAAGISLPGVMYTPGTGMDTSVDMDRVIDWLNHRFGGTDISETTMKCYRRWLASYFDAVGQLRIRVSINERQVAIITRQHSIWQYTLTARCMSGTKHRQRQRIFLVITKPCLYRVGGNPAADNSSLRMSSACLLVIQ